MHAAFPCAQTVHVVGRDTDSGATPNKRPKLSEPQFPYLDIGAIIVELTFFQHFPCFWHWAKYFIIIILCNPNISLMN